MDDLAAALELTPVNALACSRAFGCDWGVDSPQAAMGACIGTNPLGAVVQGLRARACKGLWRWAKHRGHVRHNALAAPGGTRLSTPGADQPHTHARRPAPHAHPAAPTPLAGLLLGSGREPTAVPPRSPRTHIACTARPTMNPAPAEGGHRPSPHNATPRLRHAATPHGSPRARVETAAARCIRSRTSTGELMAIAQYRCM